MNDQILAIDIGGTNTKLALINPTGEAGQVISLPTSNDAGVDNFLEEIVIQARKILAEIDDVSVAGVGVGVAGFVDPEHTKMVYNPNIEWLEGVPLQEIFAEKLNLPVYVEIDSNAAALAEATYGSGKNIKRLLVLAVGTGLGGGMTIDGEILRITNECLGDIGHVIVEPGGLECTAGCRGCAEAMVSASALEIYATEFVAEDENSILYSSLKKGEELKTRTIIGAAKQGDLAAEKAINKIGKNLGIALASMVPMLAPDQIRIAGGVSEAGQIFIEAIQSSFLENTGSFGRRIKIQKSVFGWQSVLVGAAVAQRRDANLEQ